jgi:hypothetical protein
MTSLIENKNVTRQRSKKEKNKLNKRIWLRKRLKRLTLLRNTTIPLRGSFPLNWLNLLKRLQSSTSIGGAGAFGYDGACDLSLYFRTS